MSPRFRSALARVPRVAPRPLLRALSLGSALAIGHPLSAEPHQDHTALPDSTLPEELRAEIEAGDAEHLSMRPRQALSHYERVLERAPRTYEALWRAAREAVSLGMLASSEEDRDRWYTRARAWAESAIGAQPDRPEGRHWRAVALGRLALDEGPGDRVELAHEAKIEAERVLAIDSTYAAAYHILGRWHAEIMRLSGFSRFMARTFFGADDFGEASWEDAERLMKRAVELEPDALLHHLEMARIYLDTKRAALAEAELREVLRLPVEEPTDPLLKQEAQELLREISSGPSSPL